MAYDPRLTNQWAADNFNKSTVIAVTVISEARVIDGFEGKYVDPAYIKQCVLENVLETAFPAGFA